jgi:hypothetical protein
MSNTNTNLITIQQAIDEAWNGYVKEKQVADTKILVNGERWYSVRIPPKESKDPTIMYYTKGTGVRQTLSVIINGKWCHEATGEPITPIPLIYRKVGK